MKRIRFFLEPSAPFRLDLIVWALRRRPRNLIDRWDGTRYSRILVVDGAPVHLLVKQIAPIDRPQIECVCTCPTRAIKSESACASIGRLLGLNLDMNSFQRLARRDPRLRELAGRFSGFHPPRFPTVFEAAVNAICCQQLSLEVGLELLNRLSARAGYRLRNAGESFFGPPEASKLAKVAPRALRELGFSRQKTDALLGLAEVFAKGGDRFEDLSNIDDQAAADRLMQLKGIGRWSAEYILLRALGRLNVFPGDDIAAAKNLSEWLGIRGERSQFGYDEIRTTLKEWAPFQGLVYFHLLLANLARRGWVVPAAPEPIER